MQKLDVVNRLFPLLLSGEKTSTIRFNEQRIRIGPMTYWCEGDSSKSVTVWVNRCTDMPLSDVAIYLNLVDDWPDDVMLEGMREFYSNIEISDIVQVIEHYNPNESLKYIAQDRQGAETENVF
jgi:hypothetical protein